MLRAHLLLKDALEVTERHDMHDRIPIPVTRAAALALIHWLYAVLNTAIPVTDPSERQALADLLAQLEVGVSEPTEAEFRAAKELLLRDAGDWVYEGTVYEARHGS